MASFSDVLASGNVIVGVACVGNGLAMAAINPTSGVIRATRDVVFPNGVSTTFDCKSPNFAVRNDFSADFSQLAVDVTNVSTGAENVGILATATGVVTQKDPVTDTNDESAVLDPRTGLLWYDDWTTTKVYRAAPAGDQLTYTGLLNTNEDHHSGFIVAGSRIVNPLEWLPDPAGTLFGGYAEPSENANNTLLLTRDPAHEYTPVASLKTDDNSIGGPVAWADETHLLVGVDQSGDGYPAASGFDLVTYDPTHRSLGMPKAITRDDQHTKVWPVISPDHKKVAYITKNFDGAALAEASLSESSAPISVKAGINYELLAWL